MSSRARGRPRPGGRLRAWVSPSHSNGSENARRGSAELTQVLRPKEMASTLGSGLECEFGLSLLGCRPDQGRGDSVGAESSGVRGSGRERMRLAWGSVIQHKGPQNLRIRGVREDRRQGRSWRPSTGILGGLGCSRGDGRPLQLGSWPPSPSSVAGSNDGPPRSLPTSLRFLLLRHGGVQL